MTGQQKEILLRLDDHGWRLISSTEPNEWWADEIWLVQSIWSPQVAQFHLTFLVDPQLDLHRKHKKREGIWAIAATETAPVDRPTSDQAIIFSLGHGWSNRLPDFITELSKVRHKNH